MPGLPLVPGLHASMALLHDAEVVSDSLVQVAKTCCKAGVHEAGFAPPPEELSVVSPGLTSTSSSSFFVLLLIY